MGKPHVREVLDEMATRVTEEAEAGLPCERPLLLARPDCAVWGRFRSGLSSPGRFRPAGHSPWAQLMFISAQEQVKRRFLSGNVQRSSTMADWMLTFSSFQKLDGRS